MKAFTNTLEYKNAAIARAADHRHAGNFYAWGHYWHEGKGNVSGAMYHPYLKDDEVEQDCAAYPPSVHGIPVDVAGVIDTIFGGLSLCDDKELHTRWAERAYVAIPIGADLSNVNNQLALHMLENASWLLDYADDKGSHLIGLMTAFYILRAEGINPEKRIKNFYYDHIHKLHRHQLEGRRNHANYVVSAMSRLCNVDTNPRGAWHYFIHDCVDGSAVSLKTTKGNRFKKVADLYLQLLQDAPV